MEQILVKRGVLQSLSAKTGRSAQTISRYLRGWYDSDNEEIRQTAEEIRELAIKLGGSKMSSDGNNGE